MKVSRIFVDGKETDEYYLNEELRSLRRLLDFYFRT
jgi:hypothetical protein